MTRPGAGRQCRIVLQARSNSVRLPRKVLLPVGGMPMAVLAARRLARTGIETVLATSVETTDDELAAVAARAGVQVDRGSRDDVLGRMVHACSDLPDDAVVVRATADNVFPDGDFAERLVAALINGAHGIVGTHWPDDGLPYGLSLECFRAGTLRKAAETTNAVYDREHVTPWMWRTLQNAVFDELRTEINLARLRCTIDTQADYDAMMRVFAGVDDPVGIPWRDLVTMLTRQPDAPPILLPRKQIGAHAQSAFVLGTVQLGMPYGGARRMSLPDESEAIAIVRRAIASGMTHIDTARAYGDSERRIGLALAGGWGLRADTITKLDPLAGIPDDAASSTVEQTVRASIAQSCHDLGLRRLPVLLLHRAAHRTAWQGIVWRTLLSLRSDGIIGRLGVSVSEPEEALEAAADADVTLIQLPFNILDHRFETTGLPAALARRPDIIVHARSLFLQGVLSDPALSSWPKMVGVDPGALSDWLRGETAGRARHSVSDLCLAYARAQRWIHGLVVGVETLTQLDDTLSLFTNAPLAASDARDLAMRRPAIPDTLLNPAKWPSQGQPQ